MVLRLLRLNQASYQRVPFLHGHRTFTRVPTLAPHTNTYRPTNSSEGSASRIHQLARHLSSQHLEMAQLPVSEKGYHSKAPSVYSVRKNGAPNTLEHRIYIEKDGVPVSPFHDIPLYANEQQTVLNMIVEIPRWTNAKMEVSA